MELQYHLLDVFTNQPFGGNQLAVFTSPPAGLSGEIMQRIAKELNLAEITFVLPPDDPKNDFRVRIFTPATEMPMAGHPTCGTGYLLAHQNILGDINGEKMITFEEGVGPIQVTVQADANNNPTNILMRQPLPEFLDIYEDKKLIADMLSLSVEDIHPDVPVQVVTTGVPFLYIVINSLEAMGKINLRLDLWQEHFKGTNAEQIFTTCLQTQYDGSTIHSRMFAPAFGIPEDPATGAASGPLGAYLVKYGLVPAGAMVSEQGVEMGRPSFINIEIGVDGDKFTDVIIGGESVYMGYGTLIINE